MTSGIGERSTWTRATGTVLTDEAVEEKKRLFPCVHLCYSSSAFHSLRVRAGDPATQSEGIVGSGRSSGGSRVARTEQSGKNTTVTNNSRENILVAWMVGDLCLYPPRVFCAQ